MEPELKQKWIEALVSGKYKQGTQALKRADNFCCLGVLCDLLYPDRWEMVDEDHANADEQETIAGGDPGGCELTARQRAKIGLDDFAQSTLMTLNDGEKDEKGEWRIRPHTFVEIASFISRHLKSDASL